MLLLGFAWAKTQVEPQKYFGRSLPQMEHSRSPLRTLDELYTSSEVPQNIEDLHTIVARINVTESFNVEDVDVGVTITHPYVRDLTLWLERDSVYIDSFIAQIDTVWDTDSTFHRDTLWGTEPIDSVAKVLLLDLFPGDSVVNMTECWFDDDAGRGIYEGLPPFTGGFRPLRSLDDVFAGHDAQGEWRLIVRDRFLFDEGTLDGFWLEINGIASLTGTISNSVNGNPVANATVLIIDSALVDTVGRATTLTDGSFSFSRFAAGSYRLQASAANYDSAYVDGVTIVDGQTTVQNLSLMPRVGFTDVPYTGAAVPIPDLSLITVPLEVSGLTGTIQDLDVTVRITHPYIADMFIAIQHPNSDSVVLFNPPLSPSLGANMTNCRFDDEASTPIGNGTGPFTGSYRPFNSLSQLDTLAPSGTWNLIVEDAGEADEGTLESFTLHFELPLTEDADEPVVVRNFLLHPAFPNPFNASVNLTLDVARAQNVELLVFDVTGRLVETLHSGILGMGTHRFIWSPLTAASGMYFVRAQTTFASQTIKTLLLK